MGNRFPTSFSQQWFFDGLSQPVGCRPLQCMTRWWTNIFQDGVFEIADVIFRYFLVVLRSARTNPLSAVISKNGGSEPKIVFR
jgi:hypothetical protein